MRRRRRSVVSVALRLRAVTKRFGDVTAVSGLSLDVPAGSIYGILGPNGAGKTTTLRMINDIVRPDEGTIELFGALAPGRDAARRIGYLPEERGLYPKMRVDETLAFFGQLRGLSRADAVRRGDAWLDRLDLSDWRSAKVQELSKGMQQKIQFITAVLHEPELLILDEPWSGLDPINAEVLRSIVAEQKQRGCTILFSTHLMEQAEQIVDDVCIIARGNKVVDGPLGQIKRQAARDRVVAIAFDGDVDPATVPWDDALVAAWRPVRDRIEVELTPGADARALLRSLVAEDVPLRRFEVVEPTLHQIFVDRVGAAAAEGAR
ncbi:MAG: ATP-binding cassette domain-containing protein [Deltaproteobacteria bacterium]|nr:MAG: ATP-binding cassette domain-containing protein [Deltaproteobacteria bacterium]